MTEYFQIVLKYLNYIDWINLTLLFSILLIFWNWFTFFSNFHKRSSGAFEFYFRNILLIPICIIYFVYIFNFLSPINFYSLKPTFKKEIVIVNKSKKDIELKFYGKGKRNYFQLYNNFENYLSPNFTFNKRSTKSISFDIDTSKIKYLYIIKEEKNLDFNYSQVFELNNTKLILYDNEFSKNPSRLISVDFSYYYKLILIILLTTSVPWYYYFLSFMKKNKRIFLYISIGVSVISLTTLFFIFRILFYF